ncbi:MAG: hypothetical protein HC905_20285 [Bacteroidales bacterium]|nr:hypothetical protein [Bacteroidales bacterium]
MKSLLFRFLTLSFIIVSSLLTSCYYDSEEYLYGKPGSENCPDTTLTTFAGGVKPILENYCLSCHSNAASASMGGGIKLQDYDDVKIKASNGSLLGSITHTSGYSPMPKGRAKLEDCNITVIKKWIDAGAQNN